MIYITFNSIFHTLLLKCHLSLFHNVFILVEPLFQAVIESLLDHTQIQANKYYSYNVNCLCLYPPS